MKHWLSLLHDTDFDSFLNKLRNLNPMNIDNTLKEELVSIFLISNNPIVYNSIALIFTDFQNYEIVPLLIEKIGTVRYSNHTDTLIYACSEYDCASYIIFFVELIIEFNDSSQIEAINVLEEIKNPIDLKTKEICIERLSSHLSTLDKGETDYIDISYALDLVKNMKIATNG